MGRLKKAVSLIMIFAVFGLISVSAATLTKYTSSLSLGAKNSLTGAIRTYKGGVFRQKITADSLYGSTDLETKLIYSTGISSVLKTTKTMSFTGSGDSTTAKYGNYSTGDYYYIYKNLGDYYIGSNSGHVIMWTATS